MKATLQEIFEKYPEDEFLIADGLDGAVIGVDESTMRLVYDIHKCAQIFQEEDGMDSEEAYDYVSYNTVRGAAYMGPKAPIFVYYEEDEEGFEEGQLCNRDDCFGEIQDDGHDGSCTCHTGNPPCSHCTTQTQYCDTCGWRAENV